MNRFACAATVLPAVAATALTVSAASAADSRQAAMHGSFAGYQLERVGEQVVNVRSVSARWTQPTVTPHGFHDAYSEVFVGMNDVNGAGAGVEQWMPQVGTEADSIGGHARYYAWYTPPHGANCGVNCRQFRFASTVRPGDHLAASISVPRPFSDHFTIKLTDVRHRRHLPPLRWTRTIRFTDSSAAEVEYASAGVSTPQNSEVAVPLTDFGTVRFSSVLVNGAVIGSYQSNVSQWDDVAPPLLATSSAITGNGGTFTTIWKRSS
jgi:Peptidase A4 family